nr:uncharacterized protein LOC111844071 [Paramormyrops kingsleyae]
MRDMWSMWRSIQTITDYKKRDSLTNHDESLPDALNRFFARFDTHNNNEGTQIHLPPREESALVLQPQQEAIIPTCLKTTTIIPVPKRQAVTCLNDYHPVALTPIAVKCFERLVLAHIKASIPTDLDSHQFAYHGNRSTEDAISVALHATLSHLEHPDTHARMLFIDFSSTFNSIIPHKLITKLTNLGLTTSICSWILNFLTNRPQNVRVGNRISSTLTLSTGAPQRCILSPALFTLFTHNCTPIRTSNTILRFADDIPGSGTDNRRR